MFKQDNTEKVTSEIINLNYGSSEKEHLKKDNYAMEKLEKTTMKKATFEK